MPRAHDAKVLEFRTRSSASRTGQTRTPNLMEHSTDNIDGQNIKPARDLHPATTLKSILCGLEPAWQTRTQPQALQVDAIFCNLILHCATAFRPISLGETWLESGDREDRKFLTTGTEIADLADRTFHCESTIAQHNTQQLWNQSSFDGSSIGTALLLHFFEDDFAFPYHTYDRHFSGFDHHRFPLTRQHLAALYTYPFTIEDFLKEHFPGPDLLPDVLPENWDLYHL